MTNLVRKQCPSCVSNGEDSSGDNLIIYPNGNEYCHAEKKLIKKGNQEFTTNVNTYSNKQSIMVVGNYEDLLLRKISKKTCEKADYMVAQWGNHKAEIANYKAENQAIAQKIRLPNKQFQWEGKNGFKFSMWGLYHPDNDYKKPIILTEGEIDALSLREIGLQAASLTDGAGSVTENLKKDYDELLKYKEIVLFFDNDKEGIKAKEIASSILPLEKLKIVKDYFGYKDANDLLRAELLNKIEYLEYSPDGVVFGNQLDIEDLLKPRDIGYDFPWPELNRMTRGIRKGKLILLGAGSNIGKTPFLRHIGHYLYNQYPEVRIANLYLEEEQKESPLAYLSMDAEVPIADFIEKPLSYLTKEEFTQLYNKYFSTDRLMFTNIQYDLDSNKLLNTLNYLGSIKKYDVVLLDHISMVIAASESREGERRDIDILMKNLRSVIRKTGITVIAACHLSNPDKSPDWDEGREVHQKDFRGSGSLRQIPDILLGLERNMQSMSQRDCSRVRVIKNRGYGSDVGIADELHYISKSGILKTWEQIKGEIE